MIKINRKTIIIAAMIVLLIITGYLNYRYTLGKNNGSDLDNNKDGEVPTGNFFTDYKVERETTRQSLLAQIDSVINNTNTDKDTLAEAQKMKLNISENMEKEMLIEGILKAKGFTDVIVTISSESVNVVVKDSELTQGKVAQILEVVKRETSEAAENIKIIPTV